MHMSFPGHNSWQLGGCFKAAVRVLLAAIPRLLQGDNAGRQRRFPPAPAPLRPLLLRRPQTFFDADLVALKEAPHRAATTGDPSLVHRGDDFIERQNPVAEQST